MYQFERGGKKAAQYFSHCQMFDDVKWFRF